MQERLLEAFRGAPRKVRKTDLWKAAGVSSSAVTFWFNGQSKSMAWEHAQKIAPILGVEAQWLYNGKGPKTIDLAVTYDSSFATTDIAVRESASGLRLHLEALRQSARVIGEAFGMQAADVLEAAKVGTDEARQASNEEQSGRAKPKESLAGFPVIQDRPIVSGMLGFVGSDASRVSAKRGRQ